ncbi:MAG: hypothetical protein IKV03_05175 [Alphaproteobacteria bacterium]|nr:hypothetical protein [Alphaproteobacteria bacterium]
MTFRSLLTDEPATDKITYEGIKQDFQNLHAEFEAFHNFYEKLKTITNRNDFLSQQIIGKNKKTHTRGNNCFEFVFSQDGRMDVSIIQTDGIKCVIILDVRISKHYDKSDNATHYKNDQLANRILSALDEREFYKTKNMVENDAVFKNGLIAYQNEVLQSINTTEAKFEILLNTLDTLIQSNKGVEAKFSLFYDKLYEVTQDLNETEYNKFYEFIEQQLLSDTVKRYHKELLGTLLRYNQHSEEEKKVISDEMNKIKLGKVFAKSFLNRTIDMFHDDTLSQQNIVEIYRIFNKIPTSCLYVLQDELNDVEWDEKEDDVLSDIDSTLRRKQIISFLTHLEQLKKNEQEGVYSKFKKLCEECYKEKNFLSSDNDIIVDSVHQSEHKQILNDALYLPIDCLSDKKNLDTLAYVLMHTLIKKNPSMRSLFNNPENEQVLNDVNSLGYHWFNDTSNQDTLFQAVDRLILRADHRIEENLYHKYPYLQSCISQLRQGKNVSAQNLNKIYNSFVCYTSEKEFDDIYEQLKVLSRDEQDILKAFFASDYAKNPKDEDVGGYILGSLDLIHLESATNSKQSKNKEKVSVLNKKETEKAHNRMLRQNFVKVFEDYRLNVDDVEKKQALQLAYTNLNETVLLNLNTLPQNDIMGIFIRCCTKNKDNLSAFDEALQGVIIDAREDKKRQLYTVLNDYFSNLSSTKPFKKLENICKTLSEDDFVYIIDSCSQEEKKFEKEMIFLRTYKNHKDKQFSNILDIVQGEYAQLLLQEREKRISFFEEALIAALLTSDTETNESLLLACQALTKEDVKFLLSEKEINIPETVLLKKIKPVIEQNSKNKSDKIKAHIATVQRLTDFQGAFCDFSADSSNEKTCQLLLDKYMDLSLEDLDTFLTLNQNDPFCLKFFERLRKNTKENKPRDEKYLAAVNIINGMQKKLRLYDTLKAFFEQSEPDCTENLVKSFLDVTKNGYTILSEVVAESKGRPLVGFFLKEMKLIQKKEDDEQAGEKKIHEFLVSLDWVPDFYTSVEYVLSKRESAQKKQFDMKDSESVFQLIDNYLDVQIKSLSLPQIGILTHYGLFPEGSCMAAKLNKEGFRRATEDYQRSFNDEDNRVAVIAFCRNLDETHLDEMINDSNSDQYIVGLCKDIRMAFKGKPINKIKKELGEKRYCHFLELIILKNAANILEEQKRQCKMRGCDKSR